MNGGLYIQVVILIKTVANNLNFLFVCLLGVLSMAGGAQSLLWALCSGFVASDALRSIEGQDNS